MPKGKKEKTGRGRRSGRGGDDAASEFDDKESIVDLESVASVNSDNASQADGSDKEHEELEQLEEKIRDAVDGLGEKSSQTRTESLAFLYKTFQNRILSDLLSERSETLTDSIERCLRKGKGAEQGAAALLAVAAMMQLGEEASSYLFKSMHPVMLVLVADGSVPASARAKIASALGLLTFLCGENVDEFAATMKALEAIFAPAYLKGTSPTFSPDHYGLIAAALSSWSLLISMLSAGQLTGYVTRHLPRLPGLLICSDLEVRIASGECIAVFYEILREQDESFEVELHDDLCDKLRLLATDSQKFRAKKDRKQQRSSFREILKTVEENDYPDERIKFGREVLHLDTWTRKLQYAGFCDLLGPGTNLHLASNEFLRAIFGLGPVIPTAGAEMAKLSKMDRHLGNVAAFKARTQSRNKTRDKRVQDYGDY